MIAGQECNRRGPLEVVIWLDFPGNYAVPRLRLNGPILMPRVLFVSHDADLRAVASRVLVRAGWEVTPAAHAGHASLACMALETFDVVVIDDRMADGVGDIIPARLRRYCPNVQVVRMCDEGPAAPAEGIAVVRPFTADDLIGAVAAATDYARRGATTR